MSKPRNAHQRALTRISKVVSRYGGTHPVEPIIVTMLMDRGCRVARGAILRLIGAPGARLAWLT